jgi:hypothetical protein
MGRSVVLYQKRASRMEARTSATAPAGILLNLPTTNAQFVGHSTAFSPYGRRTVQDLRAPTRNTYFDPFFRQRYILFLMGHPLRDFALASRAMIEHDEYKYTVLRGVV